MRKTLGFTLIEVLLVITLLGILSVAALSSYMNSTKTFAFVSAYKDILSVLREPRAYAVGSQTVKDSNGIDQPVERFGVYICPQKISVCPNYTKFDFKVFADNGAVPFSIDPGDTIYSTKNIDKVYVFDKDLIENSAMKNINFPITLFYETGTGNLSVYAQDGSASVPVSPSVARYLSFLFTQTATDFQKYILVFQMSGIAEGFDTKPSLQ